LGTPRQPLAWKRVDLVLDDEGTELRARARRLPAAFAPTLKIHKTSVLCEILEFLAEPRTFAELSAQFPAVDLRPKLRVLERSRLILPGDRDEREELVERLAEQLPRLAEAVANDLLGFGAALFGGDRQDAGDAIERDLTAAVALLAKAQEGLRREREPYVEQQCAGLGLAQRRDGLKLHLGGTSLPAADWINVDLQPADLRLNLRWGLPFAAGAARFVYASHLLEHFYYHEAEALLAEIRRVLCPGGVVRLVVPDIGACIAAYSARDEAFFERRMELWPWAVNCVTPLEHFLS
jgi:SAM-dependent methyltransferase